jgi:gas vesicle protein
MFLRTKSMFPSFAWVFAVGMVAGAASALLYAPGARKRMNRKLADVKDKAVDAAEDVVATMRRVARIG